MQASPTDFIDILTRIEHLKASKLVTPDEKLLIMRDLQSLIPAHANYARNCANTKSVVLRVLEEAINDGSQKSPAKALQKRQKSPEEKLLLDSDGDTGGQGVKKRVVKQTQEKRGASKGRSGRSPEGDNRASPKTS